MGRMHLYNLRRPKCRGNVKWRPSTLVDNIEFHTMPNENLANDRFCQQGDEVNR